MTITSFENIPIDTIKSFNDTWVRKHKAFITTNASSPGSKEFVVVETLRDLPYLFSPTLEKVQSVYRETLSFLFLYSEQLDPESNQQHDDFLARLEAAFSKKRCEVEIDTIGLTKKIAALRSYRKNQLTAQPNKDLFEKYKNRIPRLFLEEYEKSPSDCNLIFLVGSEKTPIPACKQKLYWRNSTWNKLLLKSESEFSLPHFSVEAFSYYINQISRRCNELPNSELRFLLDVAIISYHFGEYQLGQTILDKFITAATNSSTSMLLAILNQSPPKNLPFSIRRRILNIPMDSLWKSDLQKRTRNELEIMLAVNVSDITEYEMLLYLEEWERIKNISPGSIINTPDENKNRLIDGILFEHIPLETFIKKVMPKEYISHNKRLFYLRCIHATNTSSVKQELPKWHPRPQRKRISKI